MKLRTKFLTTISIILLAAFGITFYRTALFQDQLVIRSAERQARMLARQIVLTRKWVADHNGLFFLQGPGVEPNQFLDNPSITDQLGRKLVKRNPAMVTRELSEYANQSDFCRFRATSLNPINPNNAPDEFEQKALHQLNQGADEVIEIQLNKKKERFLRYLTPLNVEKTCLKCHSKHGYKVGDIRGGLSLIVPMEWADKTVRTNNRMLFFIAILSFLVVGLTIYLLIDSIVVRRLAQLSTAIEQYPDNSPSDPELPHGFDEIGTLAHKFTDLGHRLVRSNKELETTRRQVYQAEKLASLGRLSAGIAHEVNNPLGGMRNCVKSMKESPNDQQKQTRYLDLLDKGLKRIEQTMRQLLNFGRNIPLQLQTVDISDVISDCFTLIKYRMKNIDLNMNLELEGSYLVDFDALRQIIVNIGLNAVQAMPNGGTLTVHTKGKESSYTISISDTGGGIKKEDIENIFDPFFTTKDIGEGTGLGLSVTHALIQKMNGFIVVESKEGQGSCFIIELPKKNDDKDN